jgi:hypothetical protein
MANGDENKILVFRTKKAKLSTNKMAHFYKINYHGLSLPKREFVFVTKKPIIGSVFFFRMLIKYLLSKS